MHKLVFETDTGTYLSENKLFEEPDEDGDAFPNIDCISMINETYSMLVVEYYFHYKSDTRSLNIRDKISAPYDDMMFFLFEKQ